MPVPYVFMARTCRRVNGKFFCVEHYPRVDRWTVRVGGVFASVCAVFFRRPTDAELVAIFSENAP